MSNEEIKRLANLRAFECEFEVLCAELTVLVHRYTLEIAAPKARARLEASITNTQDELIQLKERFLQV